MTKTNNNMRSRSKLFLFALLCCMFPAEDVHAQVLTNRTPDTVRPYPAASPTPRQSPSPSSSPSGTILIADPLLFPPDKSVKRQPMRDSESELAYYIYLRGVSRVLVSAAHGRVDDLLHARFVPRILSATYDLLAQDTVSIVVPVNQTYSFTFESNDPVMVLEIVRGRGNTSPEEAIRYRDLRLGRVAGKFRITPDGVKPLRVDANHDGRFDLLIEPSARLRGLAAQDNAGPEVRFEVIDRSATTVLISIIAKDKETGLKTLYYSFDGRHTFPYQSPVRVNLNQASLIWAFAEDNAANRSAYKFEFKSN